MTNRNGSQSVKWLRRMRRVKSKPLLRRRFLLVTCLAIAAAQPVSAQGPAPTPLLSPAPLEPSAPPLPELVLPHELTKPDLEAFLDALIPAQLQSRDIAGAVVSVVKDG